MVLIVGVWCSLSTHAHTHTHTTLSSVWPGAVCVRIHYSFSFSVFEVNATEYFSVVLYILMAGILCL